MTAHDRFDTPAPSAMLSRRLTDRAPTPTILETSKKKGKLRLPRMANRILRPRAFRGARCQSSHVFTWPELTVGTCKTDTQLPPEPYTRQLADERNNGGYTNL